MPEVHVVHTGFVFNKHCEDGTLVLKLLCDTNSDCFFED